MSNDTYPKIEKNIARPLLNVWYTIKYNNQSIIIINPRTLINSAFLRIFSKTPLKVLGTNNAGRPNTSIKNADHNKSTSGKVSIRKYSKKIKLRRFQHISEFFQFFSINHSMTSQSSFKWFSFPEWIQFYMCMRNLETFDNHTNFFYSQPFFH